MSHCRWLGYSHKIVDFKRKKEAKKENIVIVVVYNKFKNTNLKDSGPVPSLLLICVTKNHPK